MDNKKIYNILNGLKKSKKLNQYSRLVSNYTFINTNYKNLKPLTYTILLTNTKVITKINGKIETTINLQRGDYVICGPKKEKYGLSLEKIINTYDLGNIKNKALTRKGFQITKNKLNKKYIEIIPSWGGTQNLKMNDFILLEKDNKKYYGVENGAFKKTYKKVSK